MWSTGNESVDAIGTLNVVGNTVPHRWYSEIKLANGKPDINAIILLSEILYWHRPRIEKDEYTGEVLGAKTRFKSNLLQRDYASFSKQFGFTKRQVSDAIKRLEDNGLIKRVHRSIPYGNKVLSNVLFIQINHVKIIEISELNSGLTLKRKTPSHVKKEDLSRYNGTPSHVITEDPLTLKRKTYTENTNTEITDTETTTHTAASGENADLFKSSECDASAEMNNQGSTKNNSEEEPTLPNIPFDVFWDLYDKKVGDKRKLAKKWAKLTDDERQLAIDTIPAYVRSTPNKRFRKHPQTYLNNKSWNDEIIDNWSKVTTGEFSGYVKLSDMKGEGESIADRVARRSEERRLRQEKEVKEVEENGLLID